MTIYLVRHPATAWSGVRYLGRHDIGWSRAGERRALQLEQFLSKRAGSSGGVITSPLRRARLLAERLASRNGLPLQIDEGWSEVDVGTCEGKTFADIEREMPELAARLARGDRAVDWPEGEQALEFEARVLAAFALAGRVWDDPTVVVSHAGPISTVVAAVAPSLLQRRYLAPGDILEARRTSSGWDVKHLVLPA
jgi:broad specificity phosphatase PhoE